MSYCSKQDLIDRYGSDELGQITTGTKGQIDDTKITRALTDTDSLVNSYIAERYTVPVNPVPSALNAAACGIARYKLWVNKASDRVSQDYKDALAWLTQIAAGTASLADAQSAPTEQVSGASVKIVASPRKFTGCSLKDL
jgi:phage gp36-like protein